MGAGISSYQWQQKNTLKMPEELWSKVRDVIISINNYLNSYDEKYIKIKFNSIVNLPF